MNNIFLANGEQLVEGWLGYGLSVIVCIGVVFSTVEILHHYVFIDDCGTDVGEMKRFSKVNIDIGHLFLGLLVVYGRIIFGSSFVSSIFDKISIDI